MVMIMMMDCAVCNALFVSHSPRHVRLAIMMMMVFVKLLMTEEPICTDYLLNIHPDKIVPLSLFFALTCHLDWAI